MDTELVLNLLRAAGAAQIAIVAASLAIPRLLGWREELARLRPLTRQVFWTYAGYILATNLALGLVTALAPHWLIADSGLALSVCAFAEAWWLARIVIQFAAFDRASAPEGAVFKLGEVALVALFVLCAVAYGVAIAFHLGR